MKTILLVVATLASAGAAAQTPPEGVFEGRMVTTAGETPTETVLMIDGDQLYGIVFYPGTAGGSALLNGEAAEDGRYSYVVDGPYVIRGQIVRVTLRLALAADGESFDAGLFRDEVPVGTLTGRRVE